MPPRAASVFAAAAVAASLLGACRDSAENAESPSAMEKEPTGFYTGHLLEKPFFDKAGRRHDHTELYLRLGMGDFFIKFSESRVTRADLEERAGEVVSVKGEIREGAWDIGPGDPPHAQSRIGPYIAIESLSD